MPVKSGSDYRLQFLTDDALCKEIGKFLLEKHNVRACNRTILKFLKQYTKRSHVSKPDGCPYCHSLKYNLESLTPQQIFVIWRDHKSIWQRFVFSLFFSEFIFDFFFFNIFSIFFFLILPFLFSPTSQGAKQVQKRVNEGHLC